MMVKAMKTEVGGALTHKSCLINSHLSIIRQQESQQMLSNVAIYFSAEQVSQNKPPGFRNNFLSTNCEQTIIHLDSA